MSSPIRKGNLRYAALMAAAGLYLTAGAARCDTPPPGTTPAHAAATDSKSDLATITVEASRDRKQIERAVDAFVSHAIVRHTDDNESLARWNEPICPLVAGFPHDQGEFVFGRLAQIVALTGARMAPEHCSPNFYIVASNEPDQFLKKWYARDSRMFNTLNGVAPIKRFLSSPRIVRVWYNRDFTDNEGISAATQPLPATGATTGGGSQNSYPTIQLHTATRLVYDGVQGLSLAIVIVDGNRLKNVNIGQLADYVSMIGLAEVNLDTDLGAVPTILHLFGESSESAPPGLSAWDEALLKSLYSTEQKNVMQLSQIKTQVVNSLAP
jgi:hypothetical protein